VGYLRVLQRGAPTDEKAKPATMGTKGAQAVLHSPKMSCFQCSPTPQSPSTVLHTVSMKVAFAGSSVGVGAGTGPASAASRLGLLVPQVPPAR